MSWTVEVRNRAGQVCDRIECHTQGDAETQRDELNTVWAGQRKARVVPDPETRRRARRAIATAVAA